MENLKWFAAFHNEGHHPHVHMIAYSVNEQEGYLSKQGVKNLRKSFANDIFAQDLLCLFQKQTEYRFLVRCLGRKAQLIGIGASAETALFAQRIVNDRFFRF